LAATNFFSSIGIEAPTDEEYIALNQNELKSAYSHWQKGGYVNPGRNFTTDIEFVGNDGYANIYVVNKQSSSEIFVNVGACSDTRTVASPLKPLPYKNFPSILRKILNQDIGKDAQSWLDENGSIVPPYKRFGHEKSPLARFRNWTRRLRN
jgi:hypothetical protein